MPELPQTLPLPRGKRQETAEETVVAWGCRAQRGAGRVASTVPDSAVRTDTVALGTVCCAQAGAWDFVSSHTATPKPRIFPYAKDWRAA